MKRRTGKNVIGRLLDIVVRELGIYAHRPLLLFCAVIAPIGCLLYFTSLMNAGLPTDLPAGLVDEDDTQVTRTLMRTLDAMQSTNIKYKYATFADADRAMKRGEIYAVFRIPKGTSKAALTGRQPTVEYYLNECYFVAGSLLMKDMLLTSNLMGLAITREQLLARGATDTEAGVRIQPIVVETHALGNPSLNYSVYLNNVLVPGILFLIITLICAYTIGTEWKHGTQKEWYALSGNSVGIALLGKLIPQILIFGTIITLYDVYFYRYLGFTCRCSLGTIVGIGWLTIMAAQGFAVFVSGILVGQVRMAMCICSLWGVVSFSLSGMAFPVSAMPGVMQDATWLMPLRHYYVLYVNQVLNGYPIAAVWSSVVALVLFALLPAAVLWRYREGILEKGYQM